LIQNRKKEELNVLTGEIIEDDEGNQGVVL
jgi:hypothetical protein